MLIFFSKASAQWVCLEVLHPDALHNYYESQWLSLERMDVVWFLLPLLSSIQYSVSLIIRFDHVCFPGEGLRRTWKALNSSNLSFGYHKCCTLL